MHLAAHAMAHNPLGLGVQAVRGSSARDGVQLAANVGRWWV